MPMTNPYRLDPTTILTPAHFLQLFRTTLKAAGWTSQGGGDGLAAYSAVSADLVFTSAQPWVAGANGFGQVRAWERLREPGGGRELVWQYGAVTGIAGQWRVKISPVSRFTGGTPSATQVPSATDEFVLAGGGTDASPTYVRYSISTSTLESSRLVAMVDQSSPYGLWFSTVGPAAAPQRLFYFHDPIVDASTSDPDPMVYLAANGANNNVSRNAQLSATEAATAPGPISRINTTYVVTPAQYPAVTASLSGITSLVRSIGGNLSDAKYYSPPVRYDRATSSSKGISSLFRWCLNSFAFGSVVTLSSAYDRIVIGDVLAEWGGTYVGP